jgi:hypothetical protein
MERHLEPFAIAANVIQAAQCHLDMVLLTFGSLVAWYQAITGPEDNQAVVTILGSLEKQWWAVDQDIFITAVIVNHFFRATLFAMIDRSRSARQKC